MENEEAKHAALQNLQNKLDMLEEKANYAKHLMEQAAYLSVLKFGTNDEEKYKNQLEVLRNEEVDLQKQIENYPEQTTDLSSPEIEVLKQKEQLLHALVSCISDLESLAGDDDQAKKPLHQEATDQNALVKDLKNLNPQSLEMSEKLEATQKVFSQLNEERSTFEQTLADLEALLHQKLNVGNDAETLTTINGNVKSEEASKKENDVSSIDAADLVFVLEKQIQEFQSTFKHLENAVHKDYQPQPIKNVKEE